MTARKFDLGPDIWIADSEVARRNFERMVAHTNAEWSGDLDATMATMTADPFQVFHSTGFRVHGYDAVRAFYQERFQTFSGQGLFAHRMVVTDAMLVAEGYYQGSPNGMFFGLMSHGRPLCFPITVWVYFEDTLLKGEAAYFDSAKVTRQIREGHVGDPAVPLVPGVRSRR